MRSPSAEGGYQVRSRRPEANRAEPMRLVSGDVAFTGSACYAGRPATAPLFVISVLFVAKLVRELTLAVHIQEVKIDGAYSKLVAPGNPEASASSARSRPARRSRGL